MGRRERFVPALKKYGASAVKGQCEHCHSDVTVNAKWINMGGHMVRIHHECWKAILVAERLAGTKKPSNEVSSASSSVWVTSENGIVMYNNIVPHNPGPQTEMQIVVNHLMKKYIKQ